ncbi:ATP-binding protein [Helcococcus ovis]|nr:ATP-binding protein [Helcococcus ovis]
MDGLLKLTDYEVENKRKVASSQMIKVANFPHVKTINDFDFNFNPEVNENQIKMLCTLKFLENNENIIFFGNSGVGKTHLATSIGIESAKKE